MAVAVEVQAVRALLAAVVEASHPVVAMVLHAAVVVSRQAEALAVVVLQLSRVKLGHQISRVWPTLPGLFLRLYNNNNNYYYFYD